MAKLSVPRPAARVGDRHVCTKSSGPIPHVGGPIIEGCKTVLITGRRAARINDKANCVGPTDQIQEGSKTVIIGGKQAARIFDKCVHGGFISEGCKTVLIGD